MSEYIPGELTDHGQGYEAWYYDPDRESIEEEEETENDIEEL